MKNKKRNWIIGASVISILLLVALFFILRPVFRKKSPAIEAIPVDAEMVFEMYNPFEQGRQLLALPIWSTLDTIPAIQQFINDFRPLDSLIKNHEGLSEFFAETTLYASLHHTRNGYRLLYTCNLKGALKEYFIDQFAVKSNKTHPLEKIPYEHGIIRRMRLSLSNRFINYAIKENIWIASFDIGLVESALATLHNKNGFTKREDYHRLISMQPPSTPFSLVGSLASMFKFSAAYTGTELEHLLSADAQQIGEFSVALDSHGVNLNGLFPIISNKGWIHSFPENEETVNNCLPYIPTRTGFILNFHAEGIKKLLPNHILTSLMAGPVAISSRYDSYHQQLHTWLIFRTNDDSKHITEQLGDSLISLSLTDSALCSIRHDSSLLASFPFGDLLKASTYYITHKDNFLIISPLLASISFYHQEIGKGSMRNYPLYKNAFSTNNKQSASWTLWVQPSLLHSFSDEKSDDVPVQQLFETISIKWTNKKEIARCQIQTNINAGIQSVIPIQSEIQFSSPPLFSPVPLIGKDTLLVTATQQHLIAFTPTGEIRWKRILESPIMSMPVTVNWYPESGTQLAYATEGKLNLIQHEGKDLPGFPTNIPVLRLLPLSQSSSMLIWEKQDHTLWSTDRNGQNKMLFAHPYPGRTDILIVASSSPSFTFWIIGNDGATTGYKANGQTVQLPAWDHPITSPVIPIMHADWTLSAIVFSDTNGSLVIRYLDITRKPVVIQRSKQAVMIHYGKFDKREENAFLIWEDNAFKLVSRNNKVIAASGSVDYGHFRLIYQSDEMQAIYDNMQERLFMLDRIMNIWPGTPIWGKMPYIIQGMTSPYTILLNSQNKFLIFSIP